MNQALLGVRLRRALLSIPALVVAALVVAYFLFAWLGFEPLIKWAAPKYIADKSRHTLTIEHASFNPFTLSADFKGVKLAEPDGKPLLAFAELLIDFEVASLFRRAYVFEKIQLSGAVADVALRADGSLNWGALIESLSSPRKPDEKPNDRGLPRLLIHHVVLESGRIDFSDNKYTKGFKTSVDPLNLALDELSTLPDDKGNYEVSARTGIGARVKWNGTVELQPLVASGELHVDDIFLARIWPYLRDALNMQPPEGKLALNLTYRLSYDQGNLSLVIDKFGVDGKGVVLRGLNDANASIALDSFALRDGYFDLAKRTATLGTLEFKGGKLAFIRAADGRFNVQDWAVLRGAGALPLAVVTTPPSKSPEAARTKNLNPAQQAQASVATPAPAAVDKAWHAAIERIDLDGFALHFIDQGTAAPFVADIAKLKIAMKADAVFGAGEPAIKVDKLGIAIDGVQLVSDRVPEPFLKLDHIALEGGHADLAAREVSATRFAIEGGRIAAARSADGNIPLIQALRPSPAMLARPEVEAAAELTKTGPQWRYRLDQIETSGVEIALRDDSVAPPLELTLQNLAAQMDGLSDDAKAQVPVQLKFDLHEGGRFEAQGKIVPGAPSADIQLKLAGLALKPIQPFVTQRSNLALLDGAASTAGRVRYQAGKFRYEGNASIDNLLLNSVPSNERFLAWKRLSTQRIVITPERFSADELLLDGLGATLTIFKDHSVNLANILKASDPQAGHKQSSDAPPFEAKPEAQQEEPEAAEAADQGKAKHTGFRVNVGRLRLTDGEVDYSDSSLALPFAAKIRSLTGSLVGLSTEPGRITQIEADGQVNEFGLARATGTIKLFEPANLTDIKVEFRNVEMTQLTPYSATFAGRKIKSGKLSLELEYKVKDRQLAGENKIVMDQLTLGERVDSPNASHLPLDLAIALLKNKNGTIDLGLPVAGSLDDPQFSYGALVWKALRNVLTKIATAPFRALSSLMGGSEEQLSQVTFDAGSAALLPPEREKLKQLAVALTKREALVLSVQPTFSNADIAALKQLKLRRAVAAQLGNETAAGENPGPIATMQGRTQRALKTLFDQRFGSGAAATMESKFEAANPALPSDSTSARLLSGVAEIFKPKAAPLSAEEVQQFKGADLYSLMIQRLQDADEVDAAQLKALSTARADAIQRELIVSGVAADRVKTEPPVAASGNAQEPVAALALNAREIPSAPAPTPSTATAP